MSTHLASNEGSHENAKSGYHWRAIWRFLTPPISPLVFHPYSTTLTTQQLLRWASDLCFFFWLKPLRDEMCKLVIKVSAPSCCYSRAALLCVGTLLCESLPKQLYSCNSLHNFPVISVLSLFRKFTTENTDAYI